MGFGAGQEIKDGGNRKFFTGVENFNVIAVCPSKGDLETLFERDLSYTPEYLGKQTVKDGDGEREVDQVRIDFYLNNGDVENPISTKESFYVMNTHHMSATGKVKVINDFGKSTWLTKEDIKNKTVPHNMSWYNTSGLKVAKRGEEELVDFIVNLLNLPFDLTKVTDPKEAHAKFEKERWDAMFKGDFSFIQSIIEGTNNKVGVALGVKIADDQSMKQVVFNKKTLRQYTLRSTKDDKYKWLAKGIDDAKANGAYGTTNFGPDDYVLREFSINADKLSMDTMPKEEDVFNQTDLAGSEDEDWLSED